MPTMKDIQTKKVFKYFSTYKFKKTTEKCLLRENYRGGLSNFLEKIF